MAELARMALEDGTSILIETTEAVGGPIKAGRVAGTIQELPETLRSTLSPVTRAARTILDELRTAAPDEVQVQFGVDLAVEAGAVITKSKAQCHLAVTMTWRSSGPDEDR